MKKILCILVFGFFSSQMHAFDLYTHLWISQQVLNDIIKNKSVTLNNKYYSLTDETLNAMIQYPSAFRMGTLAPDLFPDPVVGQITAHPGLPNGWKTDDWIQMVLNSASTPEEVSFAYGYACHAAMDIFAHSYVNAYSGDIFELTDSEVDVEIRHFALEKYIGMKMPPIIDSNGNPIEDIASLISTPKRFLTETFILNNKLTSQYTKSGSLHLVAMNSIHNAVNDIDHTIQEITGEITKLYLNYLKEQYRLVLEIDKKVGLLAQYDINVKIAEEALNLKKAEHGLMMKKIQAEKDIIDQSINIVAEAENIILQKNELMKNANNLVSQSELAVLDLRNKLLELESKISGIPNQIQQEFIEKICKEVKIDAWCGIFPIWCGTTKLVCENRKELKWIINPIWVAVDSQRQQVISTITELEKKIVTSKQDIVNYGIDIQNETEKKKNALSKKAASEANKLLYLSQAKKMELEMETLQKTYETAKQIYEKTKKEKEKLDGELEHLVNDIINVLVDITKEYNALHLLLDNWKGDIKNASDAYIEAGESFAKSILSKQGNGFSNYLNWYNCWKPIFIGAPQEIPQGICTLKNYYETINTTLNDIINKLGIFAWLIVPTKKIQDEMEKKLKPIMDDAFVTISKHILGEKNTEFFNLISGRENLTVEKLIEIYQKDESGKDLIKINNIIQLIHPEMGITATTLNVNPEKFNTIYNAVVLSKMTLLPAKSLNQIHKDYLGSSKTIYGNRLYNENSGNKRFTLLYRSVSSIDGSSQWMNTATPLYRNNGFDAKWPNERKYSYSICDNGSYGFRFWTDPLSRRYIFNKVFKGPLTPKLSEYSSNNHENLRFRPCENNPFPNTESKKCKILNFDNSCLH